jgi:hypothetical protein
MDAVRLAVGLTLVATLAGSPALAAKPGTVAMPRVAATAKRAPSRLASQDLRYHRGVTPAHAAGVDNAQFIDINNIKMFITNTGSFAWDKTSGNAGLEFPKGTGKTAVFAAGLWMGGQVGGQTRVAVSEYSDEYGPGAMVSGAADDPTKAEYKVYKLYRNYDDAATRDAALADYNAGAVIHGAPAVTVQGDGSLNILGDEMMWAVYNDADPANHTNRAGSTLPLGIEVQQTTFAFNRQGPLGNTIFIQYRMINKGANTINNMYVSQWSDPDDGYAGDDLVGCDTTLSLGFVYNGTNNDNIYGAAVPAVGYDFFQGPKVAGVPLGMTSFNKYINGTDPNDFTKTYNLMKGLNADGSPLINPTNNQPTHYQVSGDPVLGSGWLDTNPADRRLQCSSGPFTMSPGDTQVVTTAIIVGQSTNRLASISLMKFEDSQAQAAFDANFVLPAPPTQPNVVATPLNGGVRLTWDTSSENYNQPPYQWEGYVVYQGASIAGPFTRLATFDRIDGITTVLDNDFNEQQGLILPTGKAFGTDAGVQYSMDLTTDAVRGGPLHNGTTYYYTVNAYSVGLGQVPQVLESANNVIAVVPQSPAAGVDLSSIDVSAIAQSQITAGPNPTTDVVSVNVVDPAQVIDASYKVGFKPTCATCTTQSWYVVRTVGATVDTVVNNWTDFAADQQNPVFDGLQVTESSFPLGELAQVNYVPAAGAPALDGADRGLRFFDGGADYAANDLGGTVPAGTHGPNVEIRFTGGAPGQKAYLYHRMLNAAAARVYHYIGFVDVPFTVWDTNTNTQLTARFLENEGPPPSSNLDGMWDPSTAGDGGREILWVDDPATDTYSASPDPQWTTDSTNVDILNASLPLLYEFSSRSVSGSQPASGDKVVFQTSIPASSNDVFTFSTKAANRFNATIAKSELSQVLAVPNPYFTHSTYEQNQFGRVVKFTHLPANCTVRLFNLAGELVRTIHKSDNTSQLSWDLLTDRGLPVASGVYLFHVDAPGVGSKVGKVVIFMEKERLNTF